MGTRSAILMKNDDGTFSGIYCHWDGYISGVGKTLHEHYRDPAKVKALVALGDISSLGERPAPTGTRGHSFDDPEADTTIAYMRDRGEAGCETKTGATVESVADHIDHGGLVYVFADGTWTCNGLDLAKLVKTNGHA